jgi:2-methylcitrate dehydratase PrpD
MSGQLYLNEPTNASVAGGDVVAKTASSPASVLTILAAALAAPIDEATRVRAATHVLDWLGSAQMGATQPGARGFRELVDGADEGADAGACRVVGAQSSNWWHALQVNAALGNIMEMDDLHRASILHPGPVIVPAAFAIAEKVGASGAELLDAIVRGYEATIRIGRALGTNHYRYFHNTSTCGSFGAAAAAASLLKLNVEQTVWAMANAGSRTGGLWQMRHEACETKSLHNAMAAQTGVQSALLAAKGVRGPAALLEGPQGLFAAMAPGADPNDVVTRCAEDSHWLIHDVSFKPWPACRHAHPAIDAAMALAAQMIATRATPIERIEVATYKSAIDFCDKPNPTTELEAKFSLQHSVAVALMRASTGGRPMQSDFAVEGLNGPGVADMRRRVTVREDVEMTAAFPRHYRARVTVALADGTSIEHQQNDAWGDPEQPLSKDALVAKFVESCDAAGIELCVTAALVETTLSLASASDINDWTAGWPTLRPAQGPMPGLLP